MSQQDRSLDVQRERSCQPDCRPSVGGLQSAFVAVAEYHGVFITRFWLDFFNECMGLNTFSLISGCKVRFFFFRQWYHHCRVGRDVCTSLWTSGISLRWLDWKQRIPDASHGFFLVVKFLYGIIVSHANSRDRVWSNANVARFVSEKTGMERLRCQFNRLFRQVVLLPCWSSYLEKYRLPGKGSQYWSSLFMRRTMACHPDMWLFKLPPALTWLSAVFRALLH